MDAKPFMNLIRRTQHSKFRVLLMHSRMIMQCYTIDEDSDTGFHYILHIPDTEEYSDPFYQETMLLDIAEISALYKAGHELLNTKKKELKLKPKDVREELYFSTDKTSCELKFLFIANDQIIDTEVYHTEYPVNTVNKNVSSVVNGYNDMIDRVKVGGLAITIDAARYGLYDRAMNAIEVEYEKFKIGTHKVRIPLFRSMLLGMTNLDEFFISVQETVLSNIYLYTIQLSKKGITEQLIGYIVAF